MLDCVWSSIDKEIIIDITQRNSFTDNLKIFSVFLLKVDKNKRVLSFQF